MEKTNFLYFRQVPDMADDGSAGDVDGPGSAMYPASSFRYMNPTADGTISLYFDNMRANTANSAGPQSDTISLTVTQGKEKEAMQDIMAAINSNPTDGFTVMADDCITTDSATAALADLARPTSYCSSHVTAVSDIRVHNASHGYGIHEYYEVVDLGTGDSGDVAALLSVYIPDDHVLIQGAATVVEKAGSNHGLVSMNYHSSSVAFDASASSTTEWIGAAISTGMAASADIDCDNTAGVLGKSVTSHATQVNITTASYFSLVAQEDLSSMTGTPKVGIYIKWAGPAPVSITGTA